MKLSFDVKTSREIVFRGHTVMSRAEQPYLKALINLLAKKQIESVLEVGYGLGITAELIQETLRPAAHHIVEVEQSILNDCRQFCDRYTGASAIAGNYEEAVYPQKYDLLFFDPYDYELALNRVNERESYTREFNQEVTLAQRVLRRGGYLCHAFFGDCPPPELTGFILHDFGLFTGTRIVTGPAQECSQARLGYYIKD
jgi:predicted methyltransferase